MPTYLPGSFTKNFAWNSSPPGLNRLHGAIRSGFGNALRRVLRDEFRKQSGIRDRNIQLVPVNFFLHNTIESHKNYVTVDELVRQAIGNPYSRRFDQLALFSMHHARMGRRVGVAGDSNGAAFANDFVRSRLWNAGGWELARLTEAEVETAFSATVQAAPGSDTVHKCTTNYLFMFQMMGLRQQRTQFINVRIEEWIGPGLFLAFDRYSVDTLGSTLPTCAKLLEMTEFGRTL